MLQDFFNGKQLNRSINPDEALLTVLPSRLLFSPVKVPSRSRTFSFSMLPLSPRVSRLLAV